MPIGPRKYFDDDRPFVDREGYIQTFTDVVHNIGKKEYSVLVYYGVAGIGKTSLRKELTNYLEEYNREYQHTEVVWVSIDLNIQKYRETDTFLITLKNELHRKYRIKFPSFEIAHAVYWKKVNPEIALKRENYPLFEGDNIIDDLFEIIDESPYFKLIPSIARVAANAPDFFKKWWVKKGQKELSKLTEMDPSKIKEMLPYFWTQDFNDYLKTNSKSAVILIDTYEALWESFRGQGSFHSRDEWIRELIQNLNESSLWVICGREKLRWEEIDPDWKNYVEQYQLEELLRNYCIMFLESCGIKDKEIQNAIFVGSKGLPYYLDLSIDTYQRIKKKGSQQPVTSDFANTRRKIVDRFFRYLDREEIATLNVLSAPRFWNYDLFETLINKFQTGYPLTNYSDLNKFSFIISESEDQYYMHQLMRVNLQGQQDRDLKQNVHRFMFKYYSGKLRDVEIKSITEENKNALMEGFYHAKIVLETPELLKWLITSSESFEDAALWSLIFPLYEEMLQIQETKLPTEHSDIAATLHKMAFLYKDMGRYKDALPLYLRSLEIRKKVLGLEHPDVADTLNCTAWVYLKMGEYEKSLPLYKQALEIREKALVSKHPDLAKTLDNMAVLYRYMGKYEQAFPFHQKALEIRENILGPEHPDVAKSLNNMAVLCRNMGEYEKAESLYQRALELREKVLGLEHPYVALVLNNMAFLYGRMAKYEEAVSLCKRALKINENNLGLSHPSVAINLNTLAEVYKEMGKCEMAVPLCHRALEIRENNLGPSHPSIAPTLNILAGVYGSMGDYEKALLLYYQALDIREKVLGAEHPDTAETLNDLARLCRSTGESERALPLYHRALDIREKVLGPEHPDVAETLNSLADLYKSMGKPEKAQLLYQRALKIRKKVLGLEHPDTVKTLSSLAELYKKKS